MLYARQLFRHYKIKTRNIFPWEIKFPDSLFPIRKRDESLNTACSDSLLLAKERWWLFCWFLVVFFFSFLRAERLLKTRIRNWKDKKATELK